MDSATLLALVGIAGTLLGTTLGVVGTLGAARITSRGQVGIEERKARRQVYAACSTAINARRDTAIALLDSFMDERFDPVEARARLQDLEEQRGAVARAVGAVVVEGPYDVTHTAESAAQHVEVLVGRLRDWVAIASREAGIEGVQGQWRFGREDQGLVQQAVDRYSAECRRALHPSESDRPLRRRLLPRR
ncbi:hypothetical protein [Kitasatospora sp. NBC_01300]|uniref:hypothetical protein n=1 Tax=Kitasatospora sp. NBC_01300 TaxID=2903574 RepID=UPI00352F0D65|nr:hypothetical protein OG556_16045 [Kitasatospora sp. NBC_01300]